MSEVSTHTVFGTVASAPWVRPRSMISSPPRSRPGRVVGVMFPSWMAWQIHPQSIR